LHWGLLVSRWLVVLEIVVLAAAVLVIDFQLVVILLDQPCLPLPSARFEDESEENCAKSQEKKKHEGFHLQLL
jgi:hypothetical protein